MDSLIVMGTAQSFARCWVSHDGMLLLDAYLPSNLMVACASVAIYTPGQKHDHILISPSTFITANHRILFQSSAPQR